MSLLRSSFDMIIPILEVLLYDPLHDWTIPHLKAVNVQVVILSCFLSISRNKLYLQYY